MTGTTTPSTPARRPRLSAEARREAILAVATEVFGEVGYQRCRVADIAARLGVSEPVVFQNFGSKAALFAVVLEQASDRMCDMLRSGSGEDGSVSDLLAMMLAPGHLDRLHGPGAPGVLFADAMALTAEPGIEAAARKGLRRVGTTLTGVLAKGQQRGEVRADLDPATAAWWLLSLMASHRFRSAIMPQRSRREAQLGALTLQLLTAAP